MFLGILFVCFFCFAGWGRAKTVMAAGASITISTKSCNSRFRRHGLRINLHGGNIICYRQGICLTSVITPILREYTKLGKAGYRDEADRQNIRNKNRLDGRKRQSDKLF